MEGTEPVNARPKAPALLAASGRAREALPHLLATCLVLAGFFLPWMDGASVFALRSFSGFDFARLLRNLEIAADSPGDRGQITATAVAIYLVPALAVNAAVLSQLSASVKPLRHAAGVAHLVAGAYCLALLTFILLLSITPINDFSRVVGAPSWGFWLTLSGALGLAMLGVRALRRSFASAASVRSLPPQ
ncbi:MAG TPA: hypothetical protein VJN32_03340 [Dehalococcoidia bacterium]|nr:hypothetical protein [Dehalococcoidia bacterium]